MECSVCLERYDEKIHRPKALQCGHTFCQSCLLDPGFGKTCPQDRKAIQGQPQTFPDNYTILSLLADSRPALWCRGCGRQFGDACAEGGHKPCTMRQLREEDVEPRLQQLQRGVAAARQVGQLLDEADERLQLKREAARSQLQEMEAALKRLQTANRDLVNLKKVLGDADVQVRSAAQMEESARVAAAKGTCAVTLQEGVAGTAAWTTRVQLGSGGHQSLRHLLVQLLADGHFKKTEEARRGGGDGDGGGEGAWDVGGLCRSRSPTRAQDMVEALKERRLDEVRRLTGLDCSVHPQWSQVLLEAVAPRLVQLAMEQAGLEHLHCVQRMASLRTLAVSVQAAGLDRGEVPPLPTALQELRLKGAVLSQMVCVQQMAALRKLSVECASQWADAPDLPLQLEELEIVNVSKRHLQCAQRMPRLRRLSLHRCYEPGQSFQPPPGAVGVQWLSVAVKSPDLALSLVRGCATTLQELRIACASAPGGAHFFEDLGLELKSCNLKVLRRVVLLRSVSGLTVLRHDAETCRHQVEAVAARLLRAGADGKPEAVAVACSKCASV